MPITPAQLERRKQHLGSSDIPALLGLSPHKTAHDVYYEKTGRLLEEPTISPAANAGTLFEPVILDEIAERLNEPIIKNQFRSIKSSGVPIAANIDALIIRSGIPIEAKCVNFFGYTNELWGEADSDQVPDRVLIQATVHMIVTDKYICYVPTFIMGRGFVPFVVRRDEQVVEMIKETATDFWTQHVLADIPPPNSMPSAKIIARIRRQPNSTVSIPSDLVRKWEAAKKIEKAARDETETAKIELLTALGDAECGECELGTVKYLEQTKKEFLSKASTFRVLRFSAKKEEG